MAEFVLDDSYLDEITQLEQENAQRVKADLKAKRNQKQENVVSKIQEAEALVLKLKKIRNVYRIINIGSGVTLVGLVVTFLVMNWQLLMSGVEGISMVNGIGKIFGVKFVPALSIGEFIFILGLWLLLIILGGFLILIAYFADKCGVAGWGIVNGFIGDKAGVNWSECAQLFNSLD